MRTYDSSVATMSPDRETPKVPEPLGPSQNVEV